MNAERRTRIYHNPACGTSRNTLAMIRNSGVEPRIVEYLKTSPSREELSVLILQMGISVRDLLRQKGTPYHELGLHDPTLGDDELIDQMMAHPILINRPIVVTPKGVMLCRPSELVLDILPDPQQGAFTKEDGQRVVGDRGERLVRPVTQHKAVIAGSKIGRKRMSMLRSAAPCITAAGIFILSSIALHSAQGAEIEGAGSSFVAPIMTEWAVEYAKATGTTVSYDSVGSGAGIERIRKGAVDFGASDKPLSPQELEEAGLCQFPVVVGGVVPVVNLPGISAGQMRFSGALLADIYMGKVTSWDAAEIKAFNPDIALPSLAISVVHRSDGSGTTYNWVDFLSKASRAWKERVGVGLSVPWPTGVGSNGNAGVADSVTHTQGSIGYVEYSYAVQNHLAFGQVQNAHGLFVSPSADTFQSAAMTVDWRRHQDFSVLMTNAGGPDAYPITATTFILMYKAPKDPTRATAALAFFKWALENGDQQAAKLNYAPLPAVIVKLVEAYWASQIRGQGVVTGN